VDNTGGASGAQDVCEANGGQYFDGWLDLAFNPTTGDYYGTYGGYNIVTFGPGGGGASFMMNHFSDAMLDLYDSGTPYIYRYADNSGGGAPNSVINQAVQKFTVCLNTPGKAGWLATLGAIIGLQPDMPERPEGLNAQMGVSPSDGQVAPDPLMEQSLGASPGELGYNISAEKQCAKENPYVFLSPNVKLDILPGDVF
jgi:hypothetical protein